MSTMHAKRNKLGRPQPQTSRDVDGNIVDNSQSELQRFKHRSAEIPADGYEELVRLMATDEIQACLIFHQLIQGKIFNYILKNQKEANEHQ